LVGEHGGAGCADAQAGELGGRLGGGFGLEPEGGRLLEARAEHRRHWRGVDRGGLLQVGRGRALGHEGCELGPLFLDAAGQGVNELRELSRLA
jgi:hypothetical protein